MSAQSPYAQWLGTSVGTIRLEQLLDQSALGPMFLGRERASGSAVRIRVLHIPPAQTPEIAATYRHALERQAVPIATLRHPYILPLTDFGIYQGLPYLVWPHLVMRPLSTRLAQSGQMDVVAVGRYLDQIATALESAHALGLLHCNLSADCVFTQLDGQTVVADFGVRQLLETLGAREQARPFYGSLEACAPEQLTYGASGPYTDVYALGGLTYRMLTGRPVFAANTLDALLQQHLYAPIPSVLERRAGLPRGLDRMLATALAKEPWARFASPGAFTDAYHDVVSPGRGTRVPFATLTAASRLSPHEHTKPATQTHARPSTAPPPAAVTSEDKRRRLATLTSRPLNIIATALLILLLVSGGLFVWGGGRLFPSDVAPAGQVEFVDSPSGLPGHSDALHLSTKGLPEPPDGSHYRAWILNQQTEQIVPLGTLTGADQIYSLMYTGDGDPGTPSTNLLGIGDKVEITLERGDVTAPVGPVVLSGVFPPKASVHIRHLLLSFPTTPGKVGLLVGVLGQTQALNAQATLLLNAQANKSVTAVRCSAQSILNIIEGTRGPNYRLLGPSCQAPNSTQSGDGYGLAIPPSASSDPASADLDAVGYLTVASNHASLAATQSDATATIRTHGGYVQTAIANIKGWVTAADQGALQLLKTPLDTVTASELATLCDHAYHGMPSATDHQINPLPGQAGAITAYEQGQFMAAVTLTPGS
jgi:serine/threonine protein kinase